MVRLANDRGQETEDRGKETGKNLAAGALRYAKGALHSSSVSFCTTDEYIVVYLSEHGRIIANLKETHESDCLHKIRTS